MKKNKYPLEQEDLVIYKKLIKINISIGRSLQTMMKLQYSDEEKKEFRKKSYIYWIKKALFKDKWKNNLWELRKEEISKQLLEKLANEEKEIYYYLKEILWWDKKMKN